MTLQVATAAAFALFMFFLALYVMRHGAAALPKTKSPIGFAPPVA